jgi:hypothetical protein
MRKEAKLCAQQAIIKAGNASRYSIATRQEPSQSTDQAAIMHSKLMISLLAVRQTVHGNVKVKIADFNFHILRMVLLSLFLKLH